MPIAIDNLKLDALDVVYPGVQRYSLTHFDFLDWSYVALKKP